MFQLFRWASTSPITDRHMLTGIEHRAEHLLERILLHSNQSSNNGSNHSAFSLHFWKQKEAPFLAALHRLRKDLNVPTMHPTAYEEEEEEDEDKYIPPDKVLLPKHKGKKAIAAFAAALEGAVKADVDSGVVANQDRPQGDDEALDKDDIKDTNTPVQVTKVYIPPHRTNPKGEMKHIVLDGIQNSELLDLTDDPDDEEAIWVIDLDQVDCNVLYHEMEAALERRERKHRLEQPGAERTVIIRSKQTAKLPDRTNGVNMFPPSPLQKFGFTLIIMDFFDYGSMYYGDGFFCVESIVPLLGRQNIRLATRQFLNHRNVSHAGRKDTDLFFNQGAVDEASDTYWANTFYSKSRKALRYGVRSDLYMVLNQVLVKYYSNHSAADNVDMETVSLGPEDAGWNDTERFELEAAKIDVVTLPRPMDVVHFWKTGEDTEYASHRDAINGALQRIPAKRPDQSFTIFTDTLGNRDKSGRNSAQVEYAWALLQCKIFIACQRDRWEDHYRLMEGLMSGALVMSDPMHPFPLLLENGTSLVVFESLAQLQDLVLYYLDHPIERMAIARRGREVALNYHRSWHIMERIVLGNWTSIHY